MKPRVRPNSVFAHVFATKLAVVTVTVRQYTITHQFIICFSQNRGKSTILCHPFCPFHSSFFYPQQMSATISGKYIFVKLHSQPRGSFVQYI